MSYKNIYIYLKKKRGMFLPFCSVSVTDPSGSEVVYSKKSERDRTDLDFSVVPHTLYTICVYSMCQCDRVPNLQDCDTVI